MKTIDLNQLKLDRLEQIISDKLGLPITFDKIVSKGRGGERIVLHSQELITQSGLFQHAMKSVKLNSFSGGSVLVDTEKGEFLWFTLSFSFTLSSGGHNGANFGSVWYYIETDKWEVETEFERIEKLNLINKE